MKILMLCDGMERGGAETHILTLSALLVARGHTVCVVSGGGALVPELVERGVSHRTLPLASHSPLRMLYCRAKIAKMLGRERYDILHSHSRLASFISHSLARKYGAVFVTTAHARFCLSPLRRRLSRWGGSIIAVSEDIKQYLTESYALPPENITVIPNGVDGERFYPAEHASSAAGEIKIAFLSRMDSDCSRGAYLLCEVASSLCARFPQIKIVLGGGGEEFENISARAEKVNRELSQSCIECVGEVSNTADFFRSADLFVGVSRAAIEAALCGLPVILCGDEGFGGRLGEKNFLHAIASNFCARGERVADAEELLCELIALISENRDERRESAERIRGLLLSYCSAKRNAELTEKVYFDSLKKKAGRGGGTLLCGYYGFGNMGDDVLLRAAAERARRQYRGEPIFAMTARGKRDSERFGVNCVRRSSPIAVAVGLARCKRLVFGGGTLLQNGTSRRSLLYYCALIQIAHAMKKECILWGNGIGCIEGRFWRATVRRALLRCSYVGMRDMRSYAIAKHTVGNERAFLERDLAEQKAQIGVSGVREEFLLRRIFGCSDPRFIIVAPRRKLVGECSDELLREISLIGECEILAVAMNAIEDGEACAELARELGARRVSGICFDDLVCLAKRSERVYSMRYHGLVAAHLAGGEAVGVGDDEKISTFCAERGCRVIRGQ